MKTILVALNSKYIHSSLALWYLKANCSQECGEVKVKEFTINDELSSILADIASEQADVAAFSCYIWNMTQVLKLTEDLKKVAPGTIIILGGPEVSFDSKKLIYSNPFIDYVIQGEGEESFNELLESLSFRNGETTGIKGIIERQFDISEYQQCFNLIKNLDSINSPYTSEMLNSIGDRIVYYESSRGCPFSCSYCLSSTYDGVRYFSMERVKRDLSVLMAAGVKQVKFVDRTFNSNKNRAKQIFEYIIENSGETNFHFEVAGDLFDAELLEILSKSPNGLIQFEIGIQTTNEEVLSRINRRINTGKVLENIRALKKSGNINLHVDLIAGLPMEDFNSFKKSFDGVYELHTHQLQLGFLKLLKGSKIREEAEKYRYSYRSYPPYEFLSNAHMSYSDVVLLKNIEELVERYYNSGRFDKSLRFLINKYFDSPFDFYFNFAIFNQKTGCLKRSLPSRELYTVLMEFFKEIADACDVSVFNELLKLDFLLSDRSNNLPVGVSREIIHGFKEKCFEFLKDEKNIEKFLPDYNGMSAKQIFKEVHFEAFSCEAQIIDEEIRIKNNNVIYLFDYKRKDKVTGFYHYEKLNF